MPQLPEAPQVSSKQTSKTNNVVIPALIAVLVAQQTSAPKEGISAEIADYSAFLRVMFHFSNNRATKSMTLATKVNGCGLILIGTK